MSLFYVLALLINLAALAYAIRALRINGSKLSKFSSDSRKQIQSLEKTLRKELLKAQNQLNLAILDAPEFKAKKDWGYILSLTSHPARFDALAQVLADLKNQVLQPTRIIVNIAENDLNKLPSSVTSISHVEIKGCQDLGPGKKLIPTLAHQGELPIIVVDDDLILPPDLTLQLMVQHHLYPNAIIASRTHTVTRGGDGKLLPFTEWSKSTTEHDGPSGDLVATSGAGTLFPVGSLHSDAVNEDLYREIAFHTDDLWWYVQARRKGTSIRRVPGDRPLEFIPDSQEVGLWNTGNKDRNDENLTKLVARFGDVFR